MWTNLNDLSTRSNECGVVNRVSSMKICRLCMSNGGTSMEPIFRMASANGITDKIAGVTRLTLHEGDGLPAMVCQQCIFQLDMANTFIQRCIFSDKSFRSMLIQGLPVAMTSSEDIISRLSITNLDMQSLPSYQLLDSRVVGLRHEKTLAAGPNEEHMPSRDHPIKVEVSDDASNCKPQDFEVYTLPEHVTLPSSFFVENTEDDISGNMEGLVDIFADLQEGQNEGSGNTCMVPAEPPEPAAEAITQPKRKPSKSAFKKYKCAICSSEFSNKKRLMRHAKQHRKEGILANCLRARTIRNELSKHQQPTRSNEDFISDTQAKVSNTFPKTASKDRQVEVGPTLHSKGKPSPSPKFAMNSKCSVCLLVFSSPWSCARHVKRHRKEKVLEHLLRAAAPGSESPKLHRSPGSHGDLLAETQQTLDASSKTASADRQVQFKPTTQFAGNQSQSKEHKCITCLVKLASKSSLTRHAKRHKKDEISKKRRQTRVEKKESSKIPTKTGSGAIYMKSPVTCRICKKYLSSNSSLRRHMLTHTGQWPKISCDMCHTSFTRIESLKQHQVRNSCGKKHLRCELCQQCFPKKSAMLAHILSSHSDKEPFQTNQTKGKLTNHKQSHGCTKKQLLQCHLCNEKFFKRSRLQSHMTKHTGERKHKCSQCGKCFRLQKGLISHMQVHSDERPYKCTKCSMTFKWRKSLNRHITRSQNSGRPCVNTPKKKFTNKTSYKTHQSAHAKVRNWQCVCAVCDGAFENWVGLENHMPTHNTDGEQEDPNEKECIHNEDHPIEEEVSDDAFSFEAQDFQEYSMPEHVNLSEGFFVEDPDDTVSRNMEDLVDIFADLKEEHNNYDSYDPTDAVKPAIELALQCEGNQPQPVTVMPNSIVCLSELSNTPARTHRSEKEILQHSSHASAVLEELSKVPLENDVRKKSFSSEIMLTNNMPDFTGQETTISCGSTNSMEPAIKPVAQSEGKNPNTVSLYHITEMHPMEDILKHYSPVLAALTESPTVYSERDSGVVSTKSVKTEIFNSELIPKNHMPDNTGGQDLTMPCILMRAEEVARERASSSEEKTTNTFDLLSHSERQRHKCSHCNMSFKKVGYLRRHMLKSHHAIRGKIFPYKFWKESFTSGDHAASHMMLSHSIPKIHKCLQCDECFLKPNALKSHQLNHVSSRGFMCEQCEKSFDVKGPLGCNCLNLNT